MCIVTSLNMETLRDANVKEHNITKEKIFFSKHNRFATTRAYIYLF